eukprot:jgi/Mesen1/10810/ME000093S10324
MAKLVRQPSTNKVSASEADMEMQQKPVFIQVSSSSARTSSLREWDTNGDGIITEDDLIAAAIAHGKLKSKLKNYRNMIFLSLLVVLLSLAVMVAAVVIGVEMTKDTSVKDGRLVSSTSGSPVSVNQIVNYKGLVALFSTTWLQLHSIQHVTLYLAAPVDKVVYFKVEAVERNKTDLMLYSTRAGEVLDITETGAVYMMNGFEMLVEGTLSSTSGRRRSLLQTSSPPPPAGTTSSGQAGTSNGTQPDFRNVGPPCCP